MRTKPLLLICILLLCLTVTTNAQLLKKVKDKVSKTLNSGDKNSDKAEEEKSSSETSRNSNSSATSAEDDTKAKWCDGLAATGGSGGAGTSSIDGVEYRKVYGSQGGFTILYDESRLGIGSDSKGFRLVLSEKVNNKNQFVFIENGDVVARDTKVHPEWLSGTTAETRIGEKDDRDAAMKKYIVGDTVKYNIPKSDAKTATVQKINDDQMEMALQMARQSDDYKKMSDAEKKEFEENAKKALAANNSMAGTTFDMPAQQGGTVASVNGYFLIVKGKKIAKFMQPPLIDVSSDETKVFAVGLNEKGAPVMIANGKTTPLDQNKYTAMIGRIVRSADQKKFVYIEQKKMTDQELQDLSTSAGTNRRQVIRYNVIKADGSQMVVTDHNYSGRFLLTNTGALVNINEETGEVFADDKPIGKFPLQPGDRLSADAVLAGNDISQIAYFDGAEGTFTYLDGKVKKMDIIAPHYVSEGGKSYLSWFRKCGREIYIAKFSY
jgi:hypothetical protein